MAEPARRRSLFDRTVGAARGRVEGEVADTAQNVIDDLEPYLAAETVPRLVDALVPYLVDEMLPDLLDQLRPYLAEQLVPAVVDDVADHLAATTVPAIMDRMTPALVDDLLPKILDRLRPYLVEQLVPAVVDGVTPHLIATTAPEVVEGLMPMINAEVVPAVLDGVADDPRIRALVREQSWALVADGVEQVRWRLAAADDRVERGLRRLVGARTPVSDPMTEDERLTSRTRSHAGVVSRLVGGTVDLLLMALVASQGLAAALAVAGVVLGSVPQWSAVALTAVAGLAGPVYLMACWSVAGCSVGGLVAGYSVLGTDGRRLGPLRAAVRAVIVATLAVVVAAGLLLSAADPARRGLLDRLAGSRTPYRGFAGPGPGQP